MKLKILVADDSISIQKLVAMAFYNEDMEVEGISDGVKAYNYLSDFQPDLVMADIYLPGINGFELSKKIKNSDEFQNVHVLLLTSDFEELDQIMYADSEADGYISKPFKTDEIIKKVKALLGEDPAPAEADDGEYEIDAGEYEVEALDEDDMDMDVDIDVDDADTVEIETVGRLDDRQGAPSKWIELSAEDLVPPDRNTVSPEPVMEDEPAPLSIKTDYAAPASRKATRSDAFQESLDELDQLFRQLTEQSGPPAADSKPEPGAVKLQPSSHPDLIQEVMTLMNEERPSSNGKHAAPRPSRPAETDHDALHDLVHQHVRATLRTEMAGLSDTIKDTVRQIVEDVAPGVIREIIREEIARIKKSEPI